MKKKQRVKWNTVYLLGGGFLLLIIVGALLLMLPVCNTKPIAFMDALFTAVSAVCVTGLVTITPAIQFTTFGKCILLLLIQIGGLGVVACVTLFLLILRKQITIRERVVIQETYGMNGIGGMVKFVRRVLIGTFAAEGVGAAGYAITFVPEYGVVKGIAFAVFHSISAFCNAGIDIIGDSSLMKYARNPVVNITTVLLVVVSGIGFMVWFDIMETFQEMAEGELLKRRMFKHLKLHSKIAIVTTLILLGAGTFFVFVLEYTNPDTIGGMTFPQKLMASLFQSMTNRTAGFCTISQSALRDETKLLNIIQFFIGGSPGGTAGGVKTTTIAVLALTTLSVIRGGEHTEIFGRQIPRELTRTALAIVMIAVTAFLAGTVGVLIFEPDSISLIDVMYETGSAVGTVGLSAGLTPQLCRGSQVILMLLMFTGRLGPLTMALIFAGKSNPRDRIRTLPKEQVMVG